jgi:hypothetical protein
MHTLEPYPLFHANSSKIWILKRVKNKGRNYSSANLRDKDCIIFFKNEKFLLTPLAKLGNYPERTGAFYVNKSKREFTLAMPGEKWEFNIVSISAERIYLKPKKGSPFKFEMELVCYPSAF